MEQSQKKMQLLLNNMREGYACLKIIPDDSGNPVDFIFLEINPAFEKICGRGRQQIIDKRVTEVFPGIERDLSDLIKTYQRGARTGEPSYFEYFSQSLQGHFEFTVVPETRETFSLIIKDITDQIEKEERTKELNLLHQFALLLRDKEAELEDILEKTVRLLPDAMQFPDLASACITLEGRDFKTPGFKPGEIAISSAFYLFGSRKGRVEINYRKKPPTSGDHFLAQEKITLETIAQHLGRIAEQFQSRELLQESEEKLDKTLHAIGDGVIVTDTQGRITHLNPPAEKLTGWNQKEARGLFLEEIFQVQNAHTGKAALNPVYQVIKSGQVENLALNTTLIARDGSRRQIADSAAPILDHRGQIIGVIMVFSDVTEQFKAQEALRQSQEHLDAILDHTPAVIYSYQLKQGQPVINYVNQNVKNVLGFEPEEFTGQPDLWEERIHPEDQERVKPSFARILDQEKPFSAEYRFLHKGGYYRWLYEQQRLISSGNNDFEIVSVCWDITDRKRAEQLIQARLNLLTFSYNNPLDPVLQKTLDEVCEVLDSPLGFFHFVDEEEQKLTLKAWSGQTLSNFCKLKDKSGMSYRVEEAGVWTDSIRERGPVVHNNYHALPHRQGLPTGHPDIQRELVVPIIRQDRIVGILGVGNKARDYTEEDIHITSFFADLAWTIVEQKRTEEEIRYMSFHDILTGLYNRAFLDEEIKRLDSSRQFPISIIMLDLNGLKLVNDTYGHEQGDEMLQKTAETLQKSCRQEDIIGRWGGDEFVILLPRTPQEKALEISRRIHENCQGSYVQEVPLSIAFGVAEKSDEKINIADTLSEAEDNMYQQKLSESRSTRSAILHTLLQTLATKSFETQEHTRRMQEVARKIGEKLELTQAEMNRLSVLITLHDIGKINLSEEILTKKGSLTEKEWEEMKRHPATGYRIARATEEFSHVAEDILAHHEHYDGRGYPQGLKGKNIPLLARITAIADAYEVMANGRPYKEALTPQEIREEFKRCAGTQFDPELVEIFLPLLKKELELKKTGSE